MRPDGLPIWTSDAAPGRLHDLTCAELHDVTGALYWAASQGCHSRVTRTLLDGLGLHGEIARKGVPTPVQVGKR
jgi:hypothetical protein